MNWLNLETKVLHSPEYVGCKPVARATWLNVLIWCAHQENGGHISGAKAWSTRQWQQLCGVTKAEVDAAAPLLVWDGDDLVVWNYPAETESLVRTRRAAGQSGGRAKTPAKTQANRANGALGGRPETQATTEAKTEANCAENPSNNPTKGNGKEGKEMERKEREGEAAALIDSISSAARADLPAAMLAEWRTPSLEEVIGYGSGPAGSAPRDCCEVWWNEHEARPRSTTGSYTDRHGEPVKDWRASLRAFAVRWRAIDERDRQRAAWAGAPRGMRRRAPGGPQKYEDEPLKAR